MTHRFTRILHKELVPALGCTDPIGVAYAAAVARSKVAGNVERIKGSFSVNLVKNATAVCIPGTDGGVGIKLALATGALFGDEKKKLEVLDGIDTPKAKIAKDFVRDGHVEINVIKEPEHPLFMEVTVITDCDTATVVVQDDYTNVSAISVNGAILFDHRNETTVDAEAECAGLSLESICDFADTVPADELKIIRDAIDMNYRLAEAALQGDYGLNVGKHLNETLCRHAENATPETCVSDTDLINTALMWTAAGIDARMAGCPLPAMSNTGSGNQGIAATLPVASAGKLIGADEDKILRGVAISCLVSIYIKSRLGTLSALCGGVVAACGVSCGVIYLLGGDSRKMYLSLKNVFASIVGMICDGAKAGCSLKMISGIHTAMISAFLSMQDVSAAQTDGIVGRTEEESIDNFIRVSIDGLERMDDEILRILTEKADF
jgi:L-cysteine desulfidase